MRGGTGAAAFGPARPQRSERVRGALAGAAVRGRGLQRLPSCGTGVSKVQPLFLLLGPLDLHSRLARGRALRLSLLLMLFCPFRALKGKKHMSGIAYRRLPAAFVEVIRS
ncbi:unnamed protein product [Coccothraustes coccothraustes]